MAFLKKLLIGVLIAPALTSGHSVEAMTIERFDKMAISDQGEYLQLLLQGAQKILAGQNRIEELAKLNKLFNEVRPGDQMSIGMIVFEENLGRARVLDAERYAKDHNTTRLEVEHALLLSLKRLRGIVLPREFMHVGDNFRPKLPPR